MARVFIGVDPHNLSATIDVVDDTERVLATGRAMLAGVAPIPANSGQVTTRYRLHRYGDRHLHTALHSWLLPPAAFARSRRVQRRL